MKAKTAVLLRRHVETIFFLGIYTLLLTVWNLAGGSFRIWPNLWQLPPRPSPLEDLGTSLFDLHSQLPVLKLLFGLALKASALPGMMGQVLPQPLYFAVGAFMSVSLVAVAIRIVPRHAARRTVPLRVVLNPYFYAVPHYLFSTAGELLCLSLTALLSLRHFEQLSAARFATAMMPAVLFVHTRSLLHRHWFALLLAVLLARGRPKAYWGWNPSAFIWLRSLQFFRAGFWDSCQSTKYEQYPGRLRMHRLFTYRDLWNALATFCFSCGPEHRLRICNAASPH